LAGPPGRGPRTPRYRPRAPRTLDPGPLPFLLARHALRPELLRPGQVQAFIEEQAESGRFRARVLIDLIQALSFFYDSVVEQRELAGEAGHPFDLPAEEWAISETIIALDRGRYETGDWSRIRGF
jgi:hypothetical protein